MPCVNFYTDPKNVRMTLQGHSSSSTTLAIDTVYTYMDKGQVENIMPRPA